MANRRKGNRIELRDDHAAVIIQRRNGPTFEVLIDLVDVEFSKSHTWRISSSKCETSQWLYAVTSIWRDGKQKTFAMHRMLLGNPCGLLIDHRDHNTLNNRRKNLRAVDSTTNMLNRRGPDARNKSSGIRGIHRCGNKWRASVEVRGKVFAKSYETIEAAKAALESMYSELGVLAHA